MDQGGGAVIGSSAGDANGAGVAAKRFAAFISYAHADAAVAARLQKRIETYRLPPQLRSADGSTATARLGAIFRDRADLAAADSLTAAIRDALAASHALIVLCSPAAVQSHWVNEEIRLFRELNPGAPVLAAVVSGEPAEAMPAALTEDGREPLAADLRDAGDGPKLGFLKIIAALAGVPLDALIQRDAQRKLRRVMAVTVGALLALLAAVTMMTYAIQQRNEAQAQRAEAERRRAQADGLVEFMLTDLRGRLRGVGRIDIMRAAADSALDSFAVAGERTALSPDSRGQLARLLHAVGEDALSEAGGEAEAESAIVRAFGLTRRLLNAAPRDADRIFNHAQSEHWMGRIAYSKRDFRRANQHWRAYRDLALMLREVEPGGLRGLQEIAFGEGNLCTLEQAQERHGTELCRRSFEAQQAISARSPDDIDALSRVANRAGWYADALERRDGEGGGQAIRAQQLGLARQLNRRDPANYAHRDLLVSGLYSVAAGHIRNGDLPRGAALLEEARPIIADMRVQDPDNRRWRMLEGLVEDRLRGIEQRSEGTTQ